MTATLREPVLLAAGHEAAGVGSADEDMFALEGELETELADGKTFTLRAGMSYQAGDGDPPHRSATKSGAKLFIVD